MSAGAREVTSSSITVHPSTPLVSVHSDARDAKIRATDRVPISVFDFKQTQPKIQVQQSPMCILESLLHLWMMLLQA